MIKSIALPEGCKPSAACAPDQTRPVLTHGYLARRPDSSLWLFATDAYIAIALKVDGNADEGWVPFEVLKKMETREAHRGKLMFEQLDNTSWKVSNADESVVTTYTAKVGKDPKFPDVAALADGVLFDGIKKPSKPEPFGFNPDLLARVGKALGSGLRVEVSGPLKPIRFTALGHSDRLALQMPIRLMEESSYSSLRAAA